MNKKADGQIARFIKKTLREELSFIPIAVEPDGEYGPIHEDCSRKVKITINRHVGGKNG